MTGRRVIHHLRNCIRLRSSGNRDRYEEKQPRQAMHLPTARLQDTELPTLIRFVNQHSVAILIPLHSILKPHLLPQQAHRQSASRNSAQAPCHRCSRHIRTRHFTQPPPLLSITVRSPLHHTPTRRHAQHTFSSCTFCLAYQFDLTSILYSISCLHHGSLDGSR